MIDMNPMLLCDTYKTVHNMMYPNHLEKLVSYWVEFWDGMKSIPSSLEVCSVCRVRRLCLKPLKT